MKRTIGVILSIFMMMPILGLIGIEILRIYLAFLIMMTATIIAVMVFVDIQAKPPISTVLQYVVEEEKFGKRKVFVIKSKENQKKSDKVIFYIHGGAYVMEATYKHWQFLEEIVDRTGMTLILPDYPLAPKYTYKEVYAMIIPLYKSIIEKYGKDNVIAMGDSAGGGILLGLLEKMGLEHFPNPKKTILLSPWLDVRMTNPKIDEVQKRDPVLIKEALKASGKAYSGEDGMENFLVNPILGPLETLENIVIYTGTYDILNPDVHLFMEKAKEANINVDLREREKAIHIWMTHIENKKVYLAKETFEEIVNLLEEGND